MNVLLKLKLMVGILRDFPAQRRLRGWRKATCYAAECCAVYGGLKSSHARRHKMNLDFLRQRITPPNQLEDNLATPVAPEDYTVWVFWWQGEGQMPEIVKATYHSICANAGCKVVLITKDNYRDFVSVPEFMEQKVGKGFLLAHLSDYVRISLIDKYGGLWLDSTILTTKPLPQQLLTMPLFTVKAKEFDGRLEENYVASGRWNMQVLGSCETHHPLFFLMKQYLENYWKACDGTIDYLFFDYLVALLYENHEDIRKEMNELPITNTNMHKLLPLLSKLYEEMDIDKLQRDGTWMFKLTYKLKNICDTTKEGTIYKKIIDTWK